MPYLGSTPNASFSSRTKQDFTANGSTTAFTLSSAVASANDIEVFVGNVRQEPTDAYTVSGTTLTMSAAPANGLNFYVVFKQLEENSVVPADGTISSAKIQSNAITDAKIATGITASKLSGALPALDGSALTGVSAGKVLQVVMGTTNTAAQTGGSTYADTGLSATITPSATSSKVLAMVNQPLTMSIATSTGRDGGFRLVRGSTDLIQGMAEVDTDTGNFFKMPAYNAQVYLDSPNTTSATTYKTTFRVNSGSCDIYAQQHGATSSIILMEIEG